MELKSAPSLCLSSRPSCARGAHWIFVVVKMRMLRRENGFAEVPREDVCCTKVDVALGAIDGRVIETYY
jgi:hypothetical protein